MSLPLLCALSVATSAAPARRKAPPPAQVRLTEPTVKVTEALGATVLDSLAGATKVQVFRVSDSGGLRPDPDRAIASDFLRGAPGKELDAQELETLRGLLYDHKSFRFEQDVSKCRFAPHLSFQTQSGIGTLETLVSFSCNQVLFVLGKPGGRWIPQGTFDVKPVRKQLIQLAKVALPQDATTQNLK